MREFFETSTSLREQEKGLFKAWPDPRYCLVLDGAMTEYTKQSTRLLFVLKEPNDPSQKWRGDLRTTPKWYDEKNFRITIAHWTAVLLDGRRIVGAITKAEWENLLSRIAVVNLKKTGGAGSADHAAIAAFLDDSRDAEMLCRQFNLYAPHLTICGSDFVADRLAKLYRWPIEQWRQVRRGGNDDDIWELDSPVFGRVISFWHPAQRIRRADDLVRMLEEIGRETMLALGSHLDATLSQSS